MEKGGGGGGGGTGDSYTKPLSKVGTGKKSTQGDPKDDCDNVFIEAVITKPVLEHLEGIEVGSVLPLFFTPRIEKIIIQNLKGETCGYVTSSVSKLYACYNKGYKFEVALMSRNKDSSFSITIRNKR